MKIRRFTVEPVANLKKTIVASGRFVRVVQGAHPSMRISFEPPSLEQFTLQGSTPIVNGECYAPTDGGIEGSGRFDRFFLTGQSVQSSYFGATVSAQEKLVLEVIDCADPVVVLNTQRGAGWKFHHIAAENDLTEHVATSTFKIFGDGGWGASGTIDDTAIGEFLPRGYVGGGVTADAPFTVFIQQHLNKAGTRRCELARWVADAGTGNDGTDYGYGISFETEGTPLVHTMRPINATGARLLAWPMFGMSILVQVGASDINDLQWCLYARGALQ